MSKFIKYVASIGKKDTTDKNKSVPKKDQEQKVTSSIYFTYTNEYKEPTIDKSEQSFKLYLKNVQIKDHNKKFTDVDSITVKIPSKSLEYYSRAFGSSTTMENFLEFRKQRDSDMSVNGRIGTDGTFIATSATCINMGT